MHAYANGDTAAFEQLYARHKQPLYQFALNSCGNDSIARELYQDIWLRVVKSQQRYHPDVPFKAWLYRIARHRVIDYYRVQGRKPMITSTSDMGDTDVSPLYSMPLLPDEMANLAERADILNDALQSLSEVQREAVLLRHIAGMGVSEVANVVNTSTETVKSRLRYAVVKLRGRLKEYS